MERLLSSLLTMLPFLCIFNLSAQDNLVQNGDFSDSVNSSWYMNPNDAQASIAIENEEFVIHINASGTTESAPQVLLRGIPIEQNERYTLSFNVSADDSGLIRAFVISDANVLYSDSVKGKVPVTTTGTTHSIDFFVKEYHGTAVIVFNGGLSSNLTRIALDDITFIKKTDPIIVINTPSAHARWVSGTERKITWQNNGKLDIIKISFSSDSGASWSVVSNEVSNQNSFWWNIPTEISGENCLIIISDTSGTIADTSEVFRIVEAGTIDAREMIKNSDFLDTTDWRLSVNSPASAHGSFQDDQFVITIDTIGTEPWQVKLEQSGFTLENGSMYRFSFDAYASHDRTIFANIGADNGNPTWSIFGGDSIPVTLTTEKTRFYQTISMKHPTANNIRVEFNCGNDTGTVAIDNVSLIRMEASDVFIFSPSPGSILKSGATFTIEWHAAEVTTIDIEFSSDSGETWNSIINGVDNLGVIAWTVPDENSNDCFIRIRDAVGDTVIGLSSQFAVNKFGAPIKTGELIVNGSFSNYEQGWNTRFNNAQGQPEFRNEEFEITINEPGNDLSSIILSQSDLPVQSGNEYTISCAVFANGTRSMAIVVISDDNSVVLFDSTLDLPSVKKTISFRFTPETDVMARIEFHLGGSRAGIFIDDVSFYTGESPNSIIIAPQKKTSASLQLHPVGRGILFSVPNFKDNGGTITIFNLKGVVVRSLTATSEQIIWNGAGKNGMHVARGNYIAQFSNDKIKQVRRFFLSN